MQSAKPLSSRFIRHYVLDQPWAIESSYLHVVHELLALRAKGQAFTAEEIADRIGAEAPQAAARGGETAPPPGIAIIPVWGVIGHRANELRDISSRVGTSTEILGAQIAQYANDPNVKAIVLDINSPGGGVFGVAEVADQIRAARSKKPVVAIANALAASAAYWIASAASEIVVTPSGLVGSIGVFSIHEDHSAELAEAGVNVSLIKAGKFKAEDNPFGPLSDDAKTAIQGRVDDYFSMFTRSVAKGRGVALDAVRNGFGEGRVVGAKEAVAMKMADRVGTLDDVVGDLLNPDRLAALKSVTFSGENRLELAADDAETVEMAAESAETPVDTAAAIAPAALETDDVRNRRLRLRLLELGG
jgi:signal peptide peptidase SppA